MGRQRREEEAERERKEEWKRQKKAGKEARKRERSPYVDDRGYQLKGSQFGGLKPIPRHPQLDPLPKHCFRCWQKGNQHNHCPFKSNLEGLTFCFNCGRRFRTLQTCERCSEAHEEHLRVRALQSIDPSRRQDQSMGSSREARIDRARSPVRQQPQEQQMHSSRAVEQRTNFTNNQTAGLLSDQPPLSADEMRLLRMFFNRMGRSSSQRSMTQEEFGITSSEQGERYYWQPQWEEEYYWQQRWYQQSLYWHQWQQQQSMAPSQPTLSISSTPGTSRINPNSQQHNRQPNVTSGPSVSVEATQRQLEEVRQRQRELQAQAYAEAIQIQRSQLAANNRTQPTSLTPSASAGVRPAGLPTPSQNVAPQIQAQVAYTNSAQFPVSTPGSGPTILSRQQPVLVVTTSPASLQGTVPPSAASKVCDRTQTVLGQQQVVPAVSAFRPVHQRSVQPPAVLRLPVPQTLASQQGLVMRLSEVQRSSTTTVTQRPPNGGTQRPVVGQNQGPSAPVASQNQGPSAPVASQNQGQSASVVTTEQILELLKLASTAPPPLRTQLQEHVSQLLACQKQNK